MLMAPCAFLSHKRIQQKPHEPIRGTSHTHFEASKYSNHNREFTFLFKRLDSIPRKLLSPTPQRAWKPDGTASLPQAIVVLRKTQERLDRLERKLRLSSRFTSEMAPLEERYNLDTKCI